MLDQSVLMAFRGMYERMGDYISLQYGGSIAHKQAIVSATPKKRKLEFLTSIKRHLNNSFTDQFKQHCISLFLGDFVPEVGKPQIWDTTSNIIHQPKEELVEKYLYHKRYVLFLLNSPQQDLQHFQDGGTNR